MSKTKISWTDRVWNPDDRLKLPNWKTPQKVFVNSMSDLFHEDVQFEFIRKVYYEMAFHANGTFQSLTKRPQRMREFYQYLDEYTKKHAVVWQIREWIAKGMPNLWLGVTAEDQQTADERIPILLDTPAAIRWVSIEPMLDEMFIETYLGNYNSCDGYVPKLLDWVVVGCESGKNRRPCLLEWIESIVEQCKAAGVAVFVKQIEINGKVVKDVEKFPEHLRIQEFPR